MTHRKDQIRAVLDANTLYPAVLRDLLLAVADQGLYRPHWTARIHYEWMSNLQDNRPDIAPSRLQRTRDLMDSAFEQALVREADYAQFEGTISGLHDPDDAHVVAAAIASSSSYIVTSNIKDFRGKMLTPFGITAVVPDDFLLLLLSAYEREFDAAVERLLARLTRPTLTFTEYISMLERNQLPKVAAALKPL